MDRIQFVGAIRPHTPMRDATQPPEKIPRGFPPSIRGDLRSPSDSWAIGY